MYSELRTKPKEEAALTNLKWNSRLFIFLLQFVEIIAPSNAFRNSACWASSQCMKIMTNSNHVACDYVATILFNRISLSSHPPYSLFSISAIQKHPPLTCKHFVIMHAVFLSSTKVSPPILVACTDFRITLDEYANSFFLEFLEQLPTDYKWIFC
jgi:hypothetical protein